MESTAQMCFSENERNIYMRKLRLGGANLKCGRAEWVFILLSAREGTLTCQSIWELGLGDSEYFRLDFMSRQKKI